MQSYPTILMESYVKEKILRALQTIQQFGGILTRCGLVSVRTSYLEMYSGHELQRFPFLVLSLSLARNVNSTLIYLRERKRERFMSQGPLRLKIVHFN